VVAVGASIYELTPAKAICLRHCREPRLLAEGLRPGPPRALWLPSELPASGLGSVLERPRRRGRNNRR
jgi:hypothetical protein